MHFCPLARVSQLFSFLLIQLWTPTLGMCAQCFHVPSVCYSKRGFVKAPLPGLFSTSLDSVSSTFHHLSSVSTSNTHFSFFYSALLAGVFAGSWPSSHGWFIAPMVCCYFTSLASSHCQMFTPYRFTIFSEHFKSFFSCLKVKPWLSLLSNTKHNYYLCIPSPLKCTLGLILIMSVLNPLQQTERLLFFCTHCTSYMKSCPSLALCT